jgi:hypothetical protein
MGVSSYSHTTLDQSASSIRGALVPARLGHAPDADGTAFFVPFF